MSCGVHWPSCLWTWSVCQNNQYVVDGELCWSFHSFIPTAYKCPRIHLWSSPKRFLPGCLVGQPAGEPSPSFWGKSHSSGPPFSLSVVGEQCHGEGLRVQLLGHRHVLCQPLRGRNMKAGTPLYLWLLSFASQYNYFSPCFTSGTVSQAYDICFFYDICSC